MMIDEKSEVTPLGNIFEPVAAAPVETEKTEVGDPAEKKDDEVKTPAIETPKSDAEPKADAKPAVEEKKEEAAGDKKEKKEAASEQEEGFEKRWKDTQTWANNVNQKNKQLERTLQEQTRQLEVLNKKVSGNWTEDDEAADVALRAAPSPDQARDHGVMVGKALASHEAAVRELGDEHVEKVLTEFHQLFENNPIVQQTVVSAPSPVHAAIHMVERVHFEKKYGNSPKDWVANISKEALAGKEKEIRKQVLDEIRSGKRLKDETPDRISSIAGGAKGDEGKLKEEAPASLQSLFSV